MQKLREERDRLLRETETKRQEYEASRNQLLAIERAIAIVEGTEFKEPVTKTRERARNVKDTVLGMLAEAGERGLSVNQILDIAKNKGIDLDRGSVSSLLSRLKRESTLDMKEGQYFVRPPARTAERQFVGH
ncbi:MAG: hypothetical protein ACR65X_05960 [Methylocystis sp.]